MENIIDNWLQDVFEKFVKDKQLISIHIDELFPQYRSKDKEEFFTFCVSVFDTLSAKMVELVPPFTYQINIQIELRNVSRSLKGLPGNKASLIESIDNKSSPEIVIFCPSKEYWKPVVEMYACPVYFLLDNENTNYYWLYQEYRTVDDLVDNETYHRWLTGSFLSEFRHKNLYKVSLPLDT